MGSRRSIVHTHVIAPDGIRENQVLVMEGGRIERIASAADPANLSGSNGTAIDGRDTYLCAGFIDIHSDNIETIVQPRPTSVMDLAMALGEHEKILVNQGITTIYHSLSFLRENGGGALRNKDVRKPQKMWELAELIRGLRDKPRLIRHRFHCRFDMRNSDGVETLREYLESGFIQLLSFVDHTPGQGQFRDLLRYRETVKNYSPDLDDSQIDELIAQKMAIPAIEANTLVKAAEIARRQGVPIASHDDDSVEKVEFMREHLGACISEFPVELAIARKAREKGMRVVAGAPNVLLGKSHSGNLSATDSIREGVVDILCSDYYPAALLHAVFKLNREFGMPLWECLNMVTLNPAQALGIDSDFGSVEEGKKADIVMIKIVEGKPVITCVFVDGDPVSMLTYRKAAPVPCRGE